MFGKFFKLVIEIIDFKVKTNVANMFSFNYFLLNSFQYQVRLIKSKPWFLYGFLNTQKTPDFGFDYLACNMNPVSPIK